MKIINGSILDAKEQFIVHQCNSISNYASGLTKAIFEKFKYANIYSHRPYPYIAKGDDLPGHIIIRGKIIAVLAQYYPGKATENSLLDSSIVREGYFWQCLREIAKIEKLDSIAFPFGIGCGMANGNWEHYKKMIENFEKIVDEFHRVDVILYRLV